MFRFNKNGVSFSTDYRHRNWGFGWGGLVDGLKGGQHGAVVGVKRAPNPQWTPIITPNRKKKTAPFGIERKKKNGSTRHRTKNIPFKVF